jgi:hypothetical protein
MCVILVCPPKVRPDRETLELCAKANPHGAGIAWRDGARVKWAKSDDLDVIERIASKVKGEVIIHFRIASIGKVCPELRHPFPVSRHAETNRKGRTKAVLFQNGTWGDWAKGVEFAESEGHRRPVGPMSDARAAAWLTSIYGHTFLKDCGWSRWVYLSAKATVLYGEWHTVSGIKFSNRHWQPATRSTWSWRGSMGEGEGDSDQMGMTESYASRRYWKLIRGSRPKGIVNVK